MREGQSRATTPNRRDFARSRGSPRRRDEPIEASKGARPRGVVAKQALSVVEREDEAKHGEGHVVRLDLAREVTLSLRGADRLRQRFEPIALVFDERVARRTGLVVELERGGAEDAAAGLRLAPPHPPLEERAHARLAARLLQRRTDDVLDELLGGERERLDLQGVLRLEVREEAALAHFQIVGERANRQAAETTLGRDGDGVLEDRLPGRFTAGHDSDI